MVRYSVGCYLLPTAYHDLSFCGTFRTLSPETKIGPCPEIATSSHTPRNSCHSMRPFWRLVDEDPCPKVASSPLHLHVAILALEKTTEREFTFLVKTRSWLLIVVTALSALTMLVIPAQAGGKRKLHHHGRNTDGYFGDGWHRGFGHHRPHMYV
jgi:hypothetical protein